MRVDISTPLLLTILGALGVLGGFLVPGAMGLALVLGGNALLFAALVSALKHIGWF